MTLYKKVRRKSNAELALQWDALALVRDHQIRSGADLSFHRVLVPEILKAVGDSRYRRVLDVGCGTGVLSSMMQHISENIDGIDISSASIDIAENSKTSERMKFINVSVEEYAKIASSRYDLIVSNMVLMDVMNLKAVIFSVEKLLKPGGLFVFSMTNPLFWASYYGYDKASWFNYSDEIFVEGPFVISNDYGKREGVALKSTHVHRPISMYINALSDANLSNIHMSEPMPDQSIEDLYPRKWNFPRYIVGSCRAGSKVRFV